MIRYLLAALAVAASPALAAPVLDSTAHPYIQLISTDKATYKPGQSGNVALTLRNPTGSTFNGTVTTEIYLGSNIVGFTGATAISIPASGTLAHTVSFSYGATTGERGYRVKIIVKNGSSVTVDEAIGSIDYQSTTLKSTFPRQCWVSDWDGSLAASDLLTSQIGWRCNAIQAYDAYYRPELAPPSGLASWLSLANHTVSRSYLNSVISSAHSANMPIGFFQATGEAYSNWPAQAVKPKLEWGSFKNQCGLTNSCNEDDLDQSPQAPDGWTGFGWQADHLDFFDPCSPGWQQFLIDKSIRPTMGQFAFDWWQGDTVGNPPQPTYDFNGNPLDTNRCLADFTTGARARLGKPVILNNVSGWGMVDAALAGAQPYLYRETWNFDTPYYPGLNSLTTGSPYGIRRYSARAIVQPAYINRTLASGCDAGTITTGCTVNVNAALLATAMYAIAGSYYMNHHDDKCIMTNVYVPGYALPCSSATVNSLLEYKHFEVAYQNFLREAATDTTEPCNITSGATGGTSGAAGQVYVLGKTRPGFQICHMLNLTGVSSNDWTDLNGTKETPTTLSSIGMKMYYYGNTVVSGTDKLWWASPDYAQGAAQSISFTAGSDGGGKYVTFTLPNLKYWSMIALETNTTGTNLAVAARKPIRGSWFAEASPGVSPIGSMTNFAQGGRYAAYRSVEFTGTPVTSASIIYTAAKAASVNIRLGGPKGAIIASCALPAGTGVTATCPVLSTTGLHDVYLEFPSRPANLFGFYFG